MIRFDTIFVIVFAIISPALLLTNVSHI
jgi:hypothetical protein